MRSKVLASTSITLALASAPLALGFTPDADIGIRVVNGRLETVVAQGEPPSQTFGSAIERVYGADLAWSPTFNAGAGAVTIDEPGLASIDAQLSGIRLGLNLRGPLRQWNITTNTFDASVLTMSVGGGDLELSFATTPLLNSLVAGPTITVPSIPLDFHLDWTLNGATETSGTGIYLVEIELTNPTGSIASSLPIFLVYNYGLGQSDYDNALGYVENVLVPAPGSLAAAGLGLALLGRRRRTR